MTEITMPRLSDSMEEGTILRWLVADGATVARGDEIAEIETDKANMTYEADAAGVFRAVAAEGDALPVGALIAHVLADGEAPSDGAGARVSSSPPAGSAVAVDAEAAEAAGGASSSASPSMPAVGDGSGPEARVKASPVARRLAREQGVDLASLAGSGPGGRIVKADVEAAAAAPQAPAAARPSPTSSVAGGTGKGEVTTVELTSIQKTIARRMAESKA